MNTQIKENQIINIRPHHLLCIHGFVGKGYDAVFIENMAAIVDLIKSNFNITLKIVHSPDNICLKCPNLTDSKNCITQEKINRFDKMTVEILHLDYNIYTYGNIIEKIQKHLTPDKLHEICSDCSWYEYGICRDKLLKLQIRNHQTQELTENESCII